jgi:hypothetical protein
MGQEKGIPRMKTRIDEALRRDAVRFAFRFACEDCAHASKGSNLSCSLGYPPAPRREAIDDAELELCKEFELS